MTRRSSMYMRLEVQLADKSHDELVEIIARQQLQAAREPRQDDRFSEDSLRRRLAVAYYGEEQGRGRTLDMLINGIEDDAQLTGYPIREYLRRYSNSNVRRQR